METVTKQQSRPCGSVAGPGLRRCGAALAAAGVAVLLAGSVMAQAPPAPVLPAEAPPPPDRELVRSIQELLGAIGYAPGPADGIVGARTRDAIAAFQRSRRHPADGKPSAAVYRQLIDALNSRDSAAAPAMQPPPAATAPARRPVPTTATRTPVPAQRAATPPTATPAAPAADAASVVGSAWRFTDESGASFRLSFAPGGTIASRADAGRWKWTRNGAVIRIEFDNGWGRKVVRSGTVSGDRMAGQGVTAGGRTWRWTAERLPPSRIRSPFEPPPASAAGADRSAG